jgi:hypothetical protein
VVDSVVACGFGVGEDVFTDLELDRKDRGIDVETEGDCDQGLYVYQVWDLEFI